jgi:hypothetical protein
MTRRLLLFLALLALAAPQVISYTLQAPGAPAQNAGVGTIQGTIVRQGTTEPIPEVRITVTGRGGMTPQEAQVMLNALARGGPIATALPPEVLQNAQEAVRGGQASPLTAVSDNDGRFTIANVPAGAHTLRVEREGYFGTAVNGAYPPIVTLPVTVTTNQTSSVKTTLLPGGSVAGRVADTAGKPLSEVPVQILHLGYQNGVRMLQPQDLKQTDDRGEYRFYRLAPGDYFIAASQRPQALFAARGNAGPAPQEVQVTTFYPNATDPSAATRVTLRSGDDLNGFNIQMRTAAGVKVSGRVTSTVAPGPATGARGEPRPGGVILVPTDNRGLVNLDPLGAIPLGSDGGAFEFPNVAPGTYDLIARISVARGGGWGPQAPPEFATGPWAFGRALVDTRSGGVDNVAIVVRSGVDVKGRVLLDGKPTRANVRVSLQPDNFPQPVSDQQISLVLNQIRQYAPPIADDGSFTIPLIPEGRYRFQVVPNPPAGAGGRGAAAQAAVAAAAGVTPPPSLPQTAYLADIRQGGTSVYDNGLLVAGETPNPVDILLSTSSGSVEVTVLGSDQKPSSGMTVALVPAENRRQNPALYRVAESDAQGRVTIPRVPPGSYTLYAWESVPAGAYQNAEFLSKYTGRGTAVVVQSGAPATANVTAIRE